MGHEHEDLVRAWGFDHVFTWTDGPYVRPATSVPMLWLLTMGSNYHYAPHSHSGLTTHLVVQGELTLWYPGAADSERRTYRPGERVDVDAGRLHEVWIGDEGCTYVIGE